MRFLIPILLFLSTCINAQVTTINGSGRISTINKAGATSSISINKVPPVIPSATAVSKQQINLVWGAQTGATRYIIERATDAGFTDAEQVYAGTDFSFANTGLTQNTQYFYRYSWADATTETVFDTKDATTLSAGVTYDIDAEAIIAAIQVGRTLTTQQKEYIDDFVASLKAASIWTKIKTIHVGKIADWFANSVNWKNPDFEIEGFPEIYSGDIDHVNGKISYAGAAAATEIAATRAFSTNWLVPSTYLSQDNKGYTFNITDAPTASASSDAFTFGAAIGTPGSYGDYLLLKCLPAGVPQNDEARISGANVTGTDFTTGNLPGLYVFQRSGSASGNVLLRKNGTDILTTLNASTGQPTIPIGTAGYYTNSPTPNPLGYRTLGRDFFAIHESFDGTEMTAWESAVNTLLTAFNSETFTPTTPPATTGRFLKFFGDSFTMWPASQATSGDKGWTTRLGQRFHILPITHGQGSTGYFSAINNAYGQLETPSLDRIAILTGYNDVKVFGTDAEGYEYAKSAIRGITINQFLGSAVPASDASVTKTGTWSSASISTSKGNNLGGTPMQSSTAGDKISFDFTGTNVVVGVRHSDGTTVYGSVIVTIDGNPAIITGNAAAEADDEYSMNNKAYNVTTSSGFIFGAFQVKGLTDAPHTIELELLESQTTIIDYFGEMQAANLCFPVQIGDIPYDNTGIANRNANADLLTAALKVMVAAEFPEYEDIISFPATNSFYDASDPTQVSGDDIHPVDKGYKFIYRAFERTWIP